MNGVVFKQWYKSPNDKAASVLNQKHLEYIATRKGTIFNEGCGFGLWGRPPGERIPENINSLWEAKKVVAEASKEHTLYRVIISVDKQLAEKFSLYTRDNWEPLINSKIGVLAKEMNIEQKDFCWMASMHYKKNHPHVHIVYWDNSNKPRNAHVTHERFEIMANNVRAAFNREFFGQEIKDAQAEQKTQGDLLRKELQGLLQEADIPAALDLDRISEKKLGELGQGLLALATHAPSRGSMRYKYLPPAYKKKVDAWITKILDLPQFSAVCKKYSALTDQISDLYGNDSAMKAANREKAMGKLYTNMGNEVLSLVKDTIKTMECQFPLDESVHELKAAIEPAVVKLLKTHPLYSRWLSALPVYSTPVSALRKNKTLSALESALTKEIATDIRIRKRAASYYKSAAAKDGNGKKAKTDYKAVYSTVNRILHEQTAEDKGYRQQLCCNMVMRGLLRLFAVSGRRKNQQAATLSAQRSRDMSKTAKKDLRKKRSQEGDWDMSL